MTELTTIISSIGAAILSGGFVSALVSIMKLKKENKRNDAEADKLMIDAAKGLIEPLKERIDELEALVETLRVCDDDNRKKIKTLEDQVRLLTAKNNQLVNGINVLVNQIKISGNKPYWEPTPDLCVDHFEGMNYE